AFIPGFPVTHAIRLTCASASDRLQNTVGMDEVHKALRRARNVHRAQTIEPTLVRETNLDACRRVRGKSILLWHPRPKRRGGGFQGANPRHEGVRPRQCPVSRERTHANLCAVAREGIKKCS